MHLKLDSLHLEILSIKIMNRVSDKGQRCRSPACNRNWSDLLPAMKTKFLLQLYRDQMALSIGPQTTDLWSTPQQDTPRDTVNVFTRSTQHMLTGWANFRGSVHDRHMGTQTIVYPDDSGSIFLQGCCAPCRVHGKQVLGNGWFIYSP